MRAENVPEPQVEAITERALREIQEAVVNRRGELQNVSTVYPVQQRLTTDRLWTPYLRAGSDMMDGKLSKPCIPQKLTARMPAAFSEQWKANSITT